MPKQIPGFTVSKSNAPDGDFPLLYIRFRSGAVGQTKTIVEGKVFTDVDANGRLLGIEVIAPVTCKTVIDLAPARVRKGLRELLADSPYSKTALPPSAINLPGSIKKLKTPAKSSKGKRETASGIEPSEVKAKKTSARRRKTSLEPA